MSISNIDAEAIFAELTAWRNKKLVVKLSEQGDGVIAQTKAVDMTAGDLRKLAEIIGEDATITFKRSGAVVSMIIW